MEEKLIGYFKCFNQFIEKYIELTYALQLISLQTNEPFAEPFRFKACFCFLFFPPIRIQKASSFPMMEEQKKLQVSTAVLSLIWGAFADACVQYAIYQGNNNRHVKNQYFSWNHTYTMRSESGLIFWSQTCFSNWSLNTVYQSLGLQ